MWARVEACEDISKHMHRCNTPVSRDMLHFVALDCVTGVNYAIPNFFPDFSPTKSLDRCPVFPKGLWELQAGGLNFEDSVFLSQFPHSRLI